MCVMALTGCLPGNARSFPYPAVVGQRRSVGGSRSALGLGAAELRLVHAGRFLSDALRFGNGFGWWLCPCYSHRIITGTVGSEETFKGRLIQSPAMGRDSFNSRSHSPCCGPWQDSAPRGSWAATDRVGQGGGWATCPAAPRLLGA